jgi:hypothetical protein
VQRCDGARYLQNTVRKLSDPTSLFPNYKSLTFTVFNGINTDTNWHWTVSCAADAEQTRIMACINEFHVRTSIRMVRHRSPPSGDYVHITGVNESCVSSVGRQGGVSSKVQCFVKKNPALRTAPLGFNSSPNTKTGRLISCYTTHPCEQFSNRPVRTAVTHSRNSCEFTNDQPKGCWEMNLKFGSANICLCTEKCLLQQYVSDTPLVVQRLKCLRNTHLFMYLPVQRHAIHSSSSLRCNSIKTFWFSQMTQTTDMFCWRV